jgi:DNA-binding transcriptional regulator YiaG
MDRYASEIQATIARIAAQDRTPGWGRIIDGLADFLRRCLSDPSGVDAAEADALMSWVQAGGRWRLDHFGEDIRAEERAALVALLGRILHAIRERDERNKAHIAAISPAALAGPASLAGGGPGGRVEVSPAVIDTAPNLAELADLRVQLGRVKTPDERHELRVRIGHLEAAERLRTRRETLGLSQRELGAMLTPPVDEKIVARWEHARRHPDLRRRLQLADALDISPTYLDPLRPGEEHQF